MAQTFKLVRGNGDGYIGRVNSPIPQKIYWMMNQKLGEEFIPPTFSPPIWGREWIDTQIYVLESEKQGVLYYQPQMTEK
jgi:hypothetical protein